MFDIEEISKYRTSDGMVFEDEEAAMDHEIELAIKEIKLNDLITKDKFGKEINLKELWWRISEVYYVEIKSIPALNFFTNASRGDLMVCPEKLGIYRYSDEKDEWVTPQEEIQWLSEKWEAYNKEIKFTVS